MRNRKIKYWVLGLVIFSLLLTGVYALLATNLAVTGTATGAGDFKIEFSSSISSDTNKATATLNTDKTSLNIEANLSFPGDTVTVDFIIKNTGSLKATVQDLVINENSTDDISIVVNGIQNIEGTTLDVGETTQGSVVITWKSTSTIANPESVSFNITIDYIQAT